MAKFEAFFDANVLYPSGLRNFLMHLALTGIFRAHWSQEVHDEWIRNLLRNRPDITRDKLERTRRLMDQAAPDALVTGYESLIDSLELPDRDDRHVLAAAIRCGANVRLSKVFGGTEEGWLMQLAQYDLAQVRRDRLTLKRLAIA